MEASVQFLSSLSEVGFLTSISQMKKQKPREAKALAQGQVRGRTPAGTLEGPCSSPGHPATLLSTPVLGTRSGRKATEAGSSESRPHHVWTEVFLGHILRAIGGGGTSGTYLGDTSLQSGTSPGGQKRSHCRLVSPPQPAARTSVCRAPTHQGAPVSSDHLPPPRQKERRVSKLKQSKSHHLCLFEPPINT